MKLLFINQHYGKEGPATAVLLDEISAALAKRGHQIEVIASGEKPLGRLIRRERMGDVDVVQVAAAAIGNKSTLRRIWHYASYLMLALWAGLRAKRPDAIVSMSTPPIAAPLLARVLAWYHNVPYFYNVQDLYPDVAIAAKRVPLWCAKWFHQLALGIETKAAGVSTVGAVMARQIALRFPGRVTVLPNYTDVNEIVPQPRERSLREEWALNDRFIVLYSGNLGVCHDVTLMCEVIELLRGQSVDFVFASSGPATEQLKNTFCWNPRVHFMPLQSRANLPALLASADLAWVNLGKGMSRFVVPSKTFSILAAGRPLLAVSDLHDDLYNIVKRSQGGVWAPAGDAAAVIRAILRVQQNQALRTEMGLNARRFAEQNCDVTGAAAAWERWLTGRQDEIRTPEKRLAA